MAFEFGREVSLFIPVSGEPMSDSDRVIYATRAWPHFGLNTAFFPSGASSYQFYTPAGGSNRLYVLVPSGEDVFLNELSSGKTIHFDWPGGRSSASVRWTWTACLVSAVLEDEPGHSFFDRVVMTFRDNLPSRVGPVPTFDAVSYASRQPLRSVTEFYELTTPGRQDSDGVIQAEALSEPCATTGGSLITTGWLKYGFEKVAARLNTDINIGGAVLQKRESVKGVLAIPSGLVFDVPFVVVYGGIQWQVSTASQIDETKWFVSMYKNLSGQDLINTGFLEGDLPSGVRVLPLSANPITGD